MPRGGGGTRALKITIYRSAAEVAAAAVAAAAAVVNEKSLAKLPQSKTGSANWGGGEGGGDREHKAPRANQDDSDVMYIRSRPMYTYV